MLAFMTSAALAQGASRVTLGSPTRETLPAISKDLYSIFLVRLFSAPKHHIDAVYPPVDT